MSKNLIVFLLFFVIIIVFYYSWLSDSSFISESYLPQWLLDWSNKYYNLRTSIPFVFFGFLQAAFSQIKHSKKKNRSKNLIFLQNLGIAGIFISLVEFVQFFIDGRSPDLMDIYFGIVGSLVGALLYIFFNKLIKN
jgi:glycopeptide antibiotics resistance protein